MSLEQITFNWSSSEVPIEGRKKGDVAICLKCRKKFEIACEGNFICDKCNVNNLKAFEKVVKDRSGRVIRKTIGTR